MTGATGCVRPIILQSEPSLGVSGWRNPVRYTTLEDLGIDPGSLTFKPMPAPAEAAASEIEKIEQADNAPFTLTIARA